jgi:hypothetical protein
MKACGGVDVLIHIFLSSALVGGEWSALNPGRFTPGERAPGTYWIEHWVDPRDGLDDVEKREFLTSPGLKLRHPAHSQSLYRLPIGEYSIRYGNTICSCALKCQEGLSKPSWSFHTGKPMFLA